jgi:hypothetical protein
MAKKTSKKRVPAKKATKKKSAKKVAASKEAMVQLPGAQGVKIASRLEPLLVPIQDVHPDPANPRRVKRMDVLIGSFKRFGIRKPIVVNSRDGIIEAGHQTRHALLQLEATHIPVVYVDDDRLTATGYNIADNRTGEIVAEWDETVLASLLKDLKDEEATEGLGYDDGQIDSLIASFAEEGPGIDPELPNVDIGNQQGEGLTGRIVIVYDGQDEFNTLQELLGVKLGNQVTWGVGELTGGTA